MCDRAEDDGERLTAANNLAASLVRQGKYDEAEKMQREVLAVRKRVLGAEHPETLTTANNLAASLKRQGSRFMCVRVCIYVLVPALVLLCACVFACVHMMGSLNSSKNDQSGVPTWPLSSA